VKRSFHPGEEIVPPGWNGKITGIKPDVLPYEQMKKPYVGAFEIWKSKKDKKKFSKRLLLIIFFYSFANRLCITQ